MNAVFDPPATPLVPVHGGGWFPVRRIYCVGRNYADHAIEMGATGREPPFFFMKPGDAVLPVAGGSIGRMVYPELTSNLHHEVELVVAIGTGGHRIAVEDAASLIWGYAIGLDMTRRDLQNDMKKASRPWEIGKSFEQSAPIGPIHAKAATGELLSGAISLEIDGEQRQVGDLSDMIWNVNETISTLSQAWRLAPGDLIFTGTPAGVGAVQAGQLMSCRIAGLGVMSLEVVPASP